MQDVKQKLEKAEEVMQAFDDSFFNAAMLICCQDPNFLKLNRESVGEWREASNKLHRAVDELKNLIKQQNH